MKVAEVTIIEGQSVAVNAQYVLSGTVFISPGGLYSVKGLQVPFRLLLFIY